MTFIRIWGCWDTGLLVPYGPNFKLSAEVGESLPDPSVYQRLVGRLVYLKNTRPDLTFVVIVVSQFMHSPRTSYLDVVYHILQYLKTYCGLGLFFMTGA